MLHFSAVPFPCRYRPDVVCPLAETLHGREEGELVEEALPCACCAHHLTAFTPAVQRRWHLGKTELAILLAACVQRQRFYPLIRQMTVEHADRQGNRRRFLKAAQRLAACGAVRLLQRKRSSQGVLPSERETSEKRDKRWSSQDDRKHSLYRGGNYAGERERTCPAERYGVAGDYRAVSAKRDGDAGVLYAGRTDATDL
jgi:hypothetical protein